LDGIGDHPQVLVEQEVPEGAVVRVERAQTLEVSRSPS
jgi:hypothetical protein